MVNNMKVMIKMRGKNVEGKNVEGKEMKK